MRPATIYAGKGSAKNPQAKLRFSLAVLLAGEGRRILSPQPFAKSESTDHNFIYFDNNTIKVSAGARGHGVI